MSKPPADPREVPRILARWRDDFLHFVGVDRFLAMVHDLGRMGTQ